MEYNPKEIETKWQNTWQESGVFKAEESDKPKYYVLEMFPYPSGDGLHMGHTRNYTIGDIFSRYKRMNGFSVLYPMGYDSFGLPAENAAIKAGTHPKEYTENSMSNFERQQKAIGLSYDWDRIVKTCNPDYYKWNQYFFLKFIEKGLAYRKKAPVNWCKECNTVLANEQVHNGKCWRHETVDVETKYLEQWFIKTTEYAEELLNKIPELNWPNRIKSMQENWIGKSEGVNIFFPVENSDLKLEAYTTRCDTLYSVTFIVIAPEHPLVKEFVEGTEYEKETLEVLEKIKNQTEIERTTQDGKDKLGCFLGKYAINPATGEKIPIYVANFVLMYGTGIVMADAHDQRDFEFAKIHNIPLKFVISDDGKPIDINKATKAHTDDGILYDSGEFSGLHNREALPKMADWLEKNNFGKKTINYKLRDWLVSRQRYWGTPIPVIYCDDCGAVPVPESDLPVLLPEDVKFGEGNPLTTNESFVNTTCPKCNKPAKRETDTMDTFFDSSWYFLRYADNKNDKEPFSKDKVKYWMPVDQYIGGAEHACMHLIYARFFTKALRDMGMLDFDEPFTRLYNQGMVHKDGLRMSKSKGNVVVPDEFQEKYGIDTARLYMMFVAGPDKDMEWSDQGAIGSFRFMKKFFELINKQITDNPSPKELSKLNSLIKKVNEEYENFEFTKVIIELMAFTNYFAEKESIPKEVIEKLILVASPIIPHVCEELWNKLGNNDLILKQSWPTHDESKINPEFEVEDEIIETVRKDILKVQELAKLDNVSEISLFISSSWKYDFFKKVKELTKETRDFKQILSNIMNSDLKQYSKDITSLLPKLLKDDSRMPAVILTAEKEKEIIEKAKSELEAQFNSKLNIILADNSAEPKAKQASPGKPGVLIK